MSTRQQGISQHALEEKIIADYLRDHPEFFVSHTSLLADLHVPHHTDGAVSLIERQVSVLREQHQETKSQLHGLVQVARDNDRLNEQMQRLTLALLEASDLSSTLHVLNDSLLNDFHADALVVGLFMGASQLSAPADGDLPAVRSLSLGDEASASFATVINGGKPLCGHLRHRQISYLFGEIGEDNVASAVVAALNSRGSNALQPHCLGLLGIGSRDAKRYHAGMGTLFLSYLGDLIGRAVGRHLPAH
ncbi:MAG: DUF484 family protein [Gammaproteobacteria bacterium]|jgi:uncharacterized protein YigA (DUF484 family)